LRDVIGPVRLHPIGDWLTMNASAPTGRFNPAASFSGFHRCTELVHPHLLGN